LQLVTTAGTGRIDEHVFAVQELPDEAGTGVQLATGVGPVVTVSGHVVVVQAFVDEAGAATQVSAPTGPMLISGQVVAVHEFAASAGTGVQSTRARCS
jgi:predicted methyltransferase